MRILILLFLTPALFAQSRNMQGRNIWERMSRFDKNDDGKITREEFGGPERAFERFDMNRDGELTKKEVESQRGMGRGGDRGGARGGGGTDAALKKADTDKDGRVSKKEWNAVFKNADKNGDGHLDDGELRAALSGRTYVDPAPKKGAEAPKLSVTRASDGKLISLAVAKKPLVLVFGSWT